MNRPSSFIRDVLRALRTNRHEVAEDGAIFIPGARAFIGGAFAHAYAPPGEDFGPKTFEKPNRVVNEGLNRLLNLLGGHATSAPLYLTAFTGNVTPAANWTGATWPGLATEFTEMIKAQRGFQANSRVITTSDEILQELVNLKR